ncbi:MAG TPA: PA14 domain-containing protein, partial [Cytophagales bacterium]|nr:PA14 domain-containing protein [Cytophagales bacterium]
DGTITKVEFYNGNVLLGVASTAPYTYTIANAAAGSYSLRAVATDNIGSAVGSETITIHVNSTETLGTGLTGTYFNNMYLSPPQVLKRNDPTVNFEWGTGSPLNGVVSINNFSVRWTGKVLAPVTGTYTFSVQGDDGVRLTVGGSVLINNFTYKNTIDQGTISLVGGQKYDINLEYFEGGGSATVILKWAYPGQALTVVPQIKLYPSESVPSARIDLDNDKQSDYELTLYPNPTSQYLNIHVPALTALVQVSVMKIDGSEAVLEQEFHNALGEMTLPVDHLENGVYLVSISHDGYTLKEKLVVRKGN